MDKYQQILKRYWGYDDFRGIQRDIIQSIGEGHDTLGLMPTGGGKSITFQVPALCREGVCIVITPLIALMKDQVNHLRRRGILAAAVNSSMSHDDVLRILDNCILGGTRLLYISPERLASQLFITKLRHMQISFITVDEAHCISQWGYDFRPSYLNISSIRVLLPDVPILALTATATPAVVEDIKDKLQRPDDKGGTFNVFQMSFERKNLSYIVRDAMDKRHELIEALHTSTASSIVYVRSRKHAREIAELLTQEGFSATYYHAGLDTEEKDKRQNDWQADRTRIIVATNAFGMGIDKADVRLVLHYDCPDSIEAYFQEAGRAGRDGKPAQAILLYGQQDIVKLRKRVADTFPDKDYIRKVYDHIAFYFQIALGDGNGVSHEFNLQDFCYKFNHFPVQVHSALQILQRAGYLEFSAERENASRVMFVVERDELYRLTGNTPNEDRLIVVMLRNFSGMFSEYAYINEAHLASISNIDRTEVHDILLQLSRKHIIQYIPPSQLPFLRYLQRREDSKHLLFPAEVYENRRKQFSQRIEAMIHYLQDNTHCRSQQLLSYFGEKQEKTCGQCDVCVTISNDDVQAAQKQILQFLSDKKPHLLVELRALHIPTEIFSRALRYLVLEELVKSDSVQISL